MKKEGVNCKECGWPMSYDDKFCGRCGANYEVKKSVDGFKLVATSGKLIIFVLMIFVAVIGSIFLFPFGLLSWIIPGAIYQQWFGSKKDLKECRCCHKMISKEAGECPKCGCPRPIY
jgi:uncharacterized paraquat-inducible protein A